MTQTITFTTFCDGFTGSYKNNFSYDGKLALFDYLENYEEETGEQLDFDPIALCSEYSEYESLAAFSKEYGQEFSDIEELENHTQVIEAKNGHLLVVEF